MIITRLTGGLGNQMFQYAAGLALAERRRTILKLDVSWFRENPDYEAHNRYALSCLNITEQFATQEEVERVRGVQLTTTERWSLAVARGLRFYRYAERYATRANWHRPPTFRFYPAFFEQPDSTYLDGMFQSELFFGDSAELLRRHFSFRYPPAAEVVALARRIQSGPSASVHFRRGDYARNATFAGEIGVLGRGYYERAIARLRAAHPEMTLYVFSDEIDAVEQEFSALGNVVFVRCTLQANAFDALRLMSQCQHHIVANSTFSWWGAWLNPSPAKTVIAPTPWFARNQHDESDLVPPGWVRLPLSP